MFISCIIDTPLGAVLSAAEGGAVCGLWFLGQKYFPEGAVTWQNAPNERVFDEVRAYLAAYFAGEQPQELPLLSPRGTEFQRKVWDALLRVPYGQSTTYGALAEMCECRAPQAIGGAVGHNPISILIPCHRVLGTDGSLTGYAGGTSRQQALLELEGITFRSLE